MNGRVTLVGLDFGTTTSRAVVASAAVRRNSVTNRMELTQLEECDKHAVFTPFVEDGLDEAKLHGHLDDWLASVDLKSVFGGGAMLTGMAAQKENAAAFARLTRHYLQDAIIATASDPALESWLAFLGNCGDLSRLHPETSFLNLDIGGGTTNLACGRAGEVLSTGSLFVGARHVRVQPGTYQIVELSRYARELLDGLAIDKTVGDTLSSSDVSAIIDFYIQLLDEAVTGRLADSQHLNSIARLHQQVPFELPLAREQLAVTLSGGVGELVYARINGAELPSTTYFGDLGIDMAERIVQTGLWREHLYRYQPTSQGRATVYGLLRYSTQVSGNTIYLAHSDLLPLSDLPVLGALGRESSQADIERLLALAKAARQGACIRVAVGDRDASSIRHLALCIRQTLTELAFPPQVPLVLLLNANLGKALGQHITNWGTLPWKLLVIDEIDARDVQFAHIGTARDGVLPVSFYGMNH